MATKRKRGQGWEFIVRRRNVLARPLYLTFESEEEGEKYCARLEGLLDRGIVPPEVMARTHGDARPLITLSNVIDVYVSEHPVANSDESILEVIAERIGTTPIKEVDNQWSTKWVASMKRLQKLAPGTIRHHVGALARCLDWIVRERPLVLPTNPLRTLPRGYATYSDLDAKHAGGTRIDESRDRRMSPEEEKRIRSILAGEQPDDRERPLLLRNADALRCLFELALETAMRLKEMYTLETGQIDFAKRTIFLDDTKNGDKRQVPMTSVCMKVLADYFEAKGLAHSPNTSRRGDGVTFIFPWFDGNRSERNRRRTTTRLSRQFGRIFEAAKCEDLRFHDLRHEATSRFYERTTLRDREIAAITGHRDLRMLARYSNLRGSELANSLW